MHRSAPRLTRILACAAVPVMLAVAGCSSDSDGKEGQAPGAKAPSAGASSAAPGGGVSEKPTPTVIPAKYAKLPSACQAIAAKTIEDLVPKVKTKAGTPGKSSNPANRGGCSWNGLEDKGVDGSQYRWLDVSLFRYNSDPVLGSGDERAKESAEKEIAKLKATPGASKMRTSPANGIGDEATAVAYDTKKTDEEFKYATIVARTANAVVVLSFNGAGYAGDGAPGEKAMMEGATKAAKEAVAAIAAANK
ncbi:hypothetical protein [Streptomyces purpureus]|uniref:DUF3558 domain-containing protein n=1 Tax=Streptomyces purpureus TaxID=1951 RepID=A0A918H0U0_9ACTN|nr:hypothetical protein [Streptomyces purpureus]GGT30974.1 hypothetical protein GCM10014713_25470 [Streptomyces purpureus]